MAEGVQAVYIAVLLSCLALTRSQYTFDDTEGVGRSFDGIGGLSGGGATSKLLPGYPEKERNEILDYLFKPNFGASLQILKVEIGGGSQSGVGSEATHIYHEGDLNYERGYEWWIMKEAKKRNPKIKLYGLPWVFSGYVGKGVSNSPYTYPELTVNYIVKWVEGAERHHNLTIDYIGEWNEHVYNTTYLKMLRTALDKGGFKHVRIVAADDYQAEFQFNLLEEMMRDPELSDAVDIFGIHYSSTLSLPVGILWGKPLWASEDYSTLNDVQGGRCWARILNRNYVNGLMTSTISWNLIAAYYEGMPYQRCGLMTANNPWSGHYSVDTTIWMTAHTTQFTEPGWDYLSHRGGVGNFDNGGSFVSLTSEDRQHLTIIMETIGHNNSVCLHETLQPYSVQPQNVSFQLKGSFKDITKLNVWFSELGNSAQQNRTVLFQDKGQIQVVDGVFHMFLDLNQVYTLTTVSTAKRGMYPPPPMPKAFPLPYVDRFDTYPNSQEPYFVAPMAGHFEVARGREPGNKVLRQMTLLSPVDWCETENFTLSLLGNISWTDINVETRVSLDVANASDGVFVAARINSGGCYTAGGLGIFFYIFPKIGEYRVYANALRTIELGFGPVTNMNPTGWNRIRLLIKNGFAMGYVNDELAYGIEVPAQPVSGFAGLGTSGFGHADFDYICVTASNDECNGYLKKNQ